jgi:ribosomal protein S18 acetylase RimI-like enzyme
VLTDEGRFAYLCDVFVEQTLRGQGIGKALVEVVLSHPSVRDAKRCVLGTRDAHGLYERFGFVRTEPGRYMVRHADAGARK